MEKRKLLLLSLLLSLFVFYTGCKDSTTEPTPDPVNESEVLAKYVETTLGGVPKIQAMASASDVYSAIVAGSTTQVVLDIRSAADYANGHIQGAINVALKDIVTYYEANNLKDKGTVVIACYTGQTAGFACGILRLLGYTNVKDLKWGMCSWNDTTATGWKTAIANGNEFATQFVTTAAAKNAVGSLPKLSTGKTEATAILRDRINVLLSSADPFGDARMTKTTLFQNLNDYYIVNYWSAAHYALGHIPGSIQYTPDPSDLALSTALKTLPTDKKIAVYCYTGQTSAHIAAYLRALGYDAKSVLYGVNAMNYDILPANKFTTNEINTYPLVR